VAVRRGADATASGDLGWFWRFGAEGTGEPDVRRHLFKALGSAVLLMYLLMALLFGSLTLPLAVLISLSLAVAGALGAMGLTATNFTLFALLGLSLLMGLVGKNAILLVDYPDTLRKRGDSRLEALLEAGPTLGDQLGEGVRWRRIEIAPKMSIQRAGFESDVECACGLKV
jgi:multidrug efflux pump subunit AcrB